MGSNCPFNAVFEFQQFASALVFQTPKPPNCWWSENFSKLQIGGETLELDRLRSGISKLIEDTWTLINELTGGQKMATRLPPDVIDDQTDDRRGYSWLYNGSYSDSALPVLKIMSNDPQWTFAYQDYDGRLAWNQPTCIKAMKKFAKINQNLEVLSHVVPQPSSAISTEFVDGRLCNGDRLRNFYHPMMEAFFLWFYSKTTNIKGRDNCIPSFIPEPLKALLEEYFIGILPGAECLARVIWGDEAAARYHNYLWVQMGERVTADGHSQTLGVFSNEYFSARLTVLPWRHAAKAIGREFIPPQFFPGYDHTLDNTMGHTYNQSHHTYALDGGLPGGLTTDVLWAHRRVDAMWHNINGTGKGQPPLPIQLLAERMSGQGNVLGSNMLLDNSVNSVSLQQLQGVLIDMLTGLKEELRAERSHEIDRAITAVLARTNNLHGPSRPDEPRALLSENRSTRISISPDDEPTTVTSRLHSPDMSFKDPSLHGMARTDPTYRNLPPPSFYSPETAFTDLPQDDESIVLVPLTMSPSNLPRIHVPTICHSFLDYHSRRPMRIRWIGPKKSSVSGLLDDESDLPTLRTLDIPFIPGLPLMDTDDNTLGWSKQSSASKLLFPAYTATSGQPSRALKALRAVLGQNAKFKSSHQEEALELTLEMKRALLVILGTGSGKSLLFQIPPMVEEHITVVVVAYKRLLDQHLRSSVTLGIPAVKWLSGSKYIEGTKLMFLPLETADCAGFQE